MNMQTKTTAGIVRVPANTLRLAPENPRTDADEVTISELADSIKVNGQLTPLIVYLEDDKHFITAGGRRYRAMAMLGWTNEMVDVAVHEKDEAIHFGVAEQLAHEKLGRVDEVKLFASEQYRHQEPKVLASMIGKSVAYVRQHLKVLTLPEPALAAFYEGHIDYEVALGLTYFVDSDLMAETFEEVMRAPHYYSLDKLRNMYTRSFGEWDNHPYAQHVTKAAYLKAGGILEEDLFGGSALIRSPDVLEELATKAIAKIVKKEAPDHETVMQIDENESIWMLKSHPGQNLLTADENAEFCQLLDADLDGMVESFPDEGEDYEFEHLDGEIVTVKWARERIKELEAKETSYPEALAKLLVTAWQLRPHSRSGYLSHSACIMPENEQALADAGFIEQPADPMEGELEEGSTQPEEGLTGALRDRIAKVVLHANRQLLSQEPNTILSAYSDSMSGRYPLTVRFDMRPVDGPAVTLHHDKAYEKLQTQADKAGSKPADVRDRLAYHLLLRVSEVDGTPDAETIRRYFTPDADFLKAYKAPELLVMLEHWPDTKLSSKDKRSVLVEKLADLAAKEKSWLPLGF